MNTQRFLSHLASSIPPSGIRKFFDVVAGMEDAISLGVGEPDFPTPWNARNAAVKSIQKGYTRYTSNAGLFELREAASAYFRERFSLDYDPADEVLITVGASEAIDLCFRAVINPGDEVLIPQPSYVSYAPNVTLCGGRPVPVECFESEDFKLLPEHLERVITPKTKVLLLPYPNNPTGAVMEREALLALLPIIEKYDLLVVSDEIYCELTYGKVHVSIASLPGMRDRTLVINGFSKAFSMTGWRVGLLAAPREFLKVILKIHQYVIMCAPSMGQYAALEALRSGLKDNFAEVAKMRAQYDMRRRFMVQSLNDMGLHCFEPKGAFYVFPSVRELEMDGETFAETLLKEQKVAVVPGAAFGESGRNFVRMSYAYSMRSLDEAVGRLADFVSRHGSKIGDRNHSSETD